MLWIPTIFVQIKSMDLSIEWVTCDSAAKCTIQSE